MRQAEPLKENQGLQKTAQHSQCEPTHDTACDDGSLGAATSRGIWIGGARLKDVGFMGEEGLAAGERGMSEGQVRVMLERWWYLDALLAQAAQNTIRFIDASNISSS
jgi:hypothetical protein